MSDRIRYSRVKNGIRYFEPTPRMRQCGFEPRSLGPEGEEARDAAVRLYSDWTAARRKAPASRALPLTEISGRSVGYVYFLMTADRVKIGYSKKLTARAGELRTGLPDSISSYVAIAGSPRDEKLLHRRLSAFRVRGEWFTLAAAVRQVIMRSLAFGRPMHDQEERMADTEVGSFQLATPGANP